MHRLPVLACAFIPALAVSQPAPSLLQGMRDQARPVLLFGGNSDSRIGTQYTELLKHTQDLQDRVLRLVVVSHSSTSCSSAPPAGTVAATEPEQVVLRSTFHVARRDFAIILIGKDGGEKFRSTQPVSFETLRVFVDAMPMRQQEMHSR